jgi:hypothetical protein
MNRRRHVKDKATNIAVTVEFLSSRAERAIAAGFAKQKWVQFCEAMLARGHSLTIYEARQTVSKYITVRTGKKTFKVRFSNHKPIKHRELAEDCDFFVGWTHTGVRTTDQAIEAVDAFFGAVTP